MNRVVEQRILPVRGCTGWKHCATTPLRFMVPMHAHSARGLPMNHPKIGESQRCFSPRDFPSLAFPNLWDLSFRFRGPMRGGFRGNLTPDLSPSERGESQGEGAS